jgi:hypothetical protein
LLAVLPPARTSTRSISSSTFAAYAANHGTGSAEGGMLSLETLCGAADRANVQPNGYR